MKNPLPYLALIAASLAPLGAEAQYNAVPGYTFGGMFPGMFGGNNYGIPQGFMNNGQSPFLTMPAPQYPMASPQFPSANSPQQSPSFPAAPMAQPTPFWMQTPQSTQPPARFITDAPTNTAPQNAPSTYSFFATPGFTATPPRWAPLPGQAPVPFQDIRPSNIWSIFPNTSQAPVPVVPATPPKWPTP